MQCSPLSAREARRAATSWQIRRSALTLTAERGFDGWTMDDLAATAGVARRTLFNYFPGKIEAVLGPEHEPVPEDAAAFVAGGPSGHLFDDLAHFAVRHLTVRSADLSTDLELEQLVRLAVRRDARLLAEVHDRVVRVSEHGVDLILQREGAGFGVANAQLALRLLVMIIDTVVEFSDPDSEEPFADQVTAAVRSARTLIAH